MKMNPAIKILELLRQVVNALPHIFHLQILILVAFLVWKFLKSRETQGRRLPPSPAGWPVIGNIPQMLMNRPTYKWIHRVMEEMKTDIACFRFAGVHVITITSDEIAREAFKDKDAIFADRMESFSSEFLSRGYKALGYYNYGETWKKIRSIMTTEILSTGRLNWLLDTRNIEADNLFAYVQNLYKRSMTVNVRDIVRTYCHAVTMRLMFGRRHFKEATTDDGGLGQMEKEHVDASFTAMDNAFSFCISDYIPFLRGWDVDGHEKIVREAGEIIFKYNDMIIKERLELWRDKGGKADVEDWLDIFITLKDAEGKPLLSPEEILANLTEIWLAAMDNPTNIVEWTMAEMLKNREILEKAVEEIDRVVGTERLVQESDIPNLNYVKSCGRESFRLHPIGPFVVPHVSSQDATLGGYFIPKGSHILVSRLGLGINPRIWKDPYVFKPERHLGTMAADCQFEVAFVDPDMRFVSFGIGRRGCVAVKLGTTMTVMLLGRLLQGFNWSLPPGTDQVELIRSDNTMLMAKPLLACVEPRLTSDMYPKLRN